MLQSVGSQRVGTTERLNWTDGTGDTGSISGLGDAVRCATARLMCRSYCTL